eukprot:403361679
MISDFSCGSCNRIFNYDNRKPILLPCDDTVCLECVQERILGRNQSKDSQSLTCCIDNSHQFPTLDVTKIDSQILEEFTDKNVLSIVCDQHQDYFAKYWCPKCQVKVCDKCSYTTHEYHYGIQQIPQQQSCYENFVNKMIPKIGCFVDLIQSKKLKILSLKNHDILTVSEYQECAEFFHQVTNVFNKQIKTHSTSQNNNCNKLQQLLLDTIPTDTTSDELKLEFNVISNCSIVQIQSSQEGTSSSSSSSNSDHEDTSSQNTEEYIEELLQQELLQQDNSNLLLQAQTALLVHRQIYEGSDKLKSHITKNLEKQLEFVKLQEQFATELIGFYKQYDEKEQKLNDLTKVLIQKIRAVQGQSNEVQVPHGDQETVVQPEISYIRTIPAILEPRIQEFQRIVDIEVHKQEGSLFASHLQNYQNAEFRLLYQGTRDGFTADQLEARLKHQTSDHTITFIQSNHGQVFGGFSRVKRTFPDIEANIFDTEAFIFQLNKRKVLKLNQNNGNRRFAVTHKRDHLFCVGSWEIQIKSGCNLDSRICNASLEFCYKYPEELQIDNIKINPGSDCKDEQLFNLNHVDEDVNHIRERKSYLAGAENFLVEEIEIYEIIYYAQQEN